MIRYLQGDASVEAAYECGVYVHIVRTQRVFRMGVGGGLMMIAHLTGENEIILGMVGMLLMIELIFYCYEFLTENNILRWSNANTTSLVLLCFTATLLYNFPALVLALSDSLPLVLVGFLWMAGITVYTANVYATIPRFYWASFGPPGVLLIFATLVQYRTSFAAPSDWHWAFLAVGVGLFLYNALKLLVDHSEINRALRQARGEAEQRMIALEQLSQSDKLTGLYNRSHFDACLAKLLEAKSKRDEIAVLLIDLDKFKPINDSYGHATGDLVLETIATRLRDFVGERGFAARLGGDEFGIVLRGIHEANDIQFEAERLAQLIFEPIELENTTLVVGASIGIGLSSMGLDTLDRICKCADQAMFRAKKQPDNRVVLYDPHTFRKRPDFADRMAIENALLEEKIKPYYQPKIDLINNSIVGFEALARWEKTYGKAKLPGAFIGLIAEFGYMPRFTLSIMGQVLRDIDAWKAEGLDPGLVAINIDETTLATRNGQQDLIALLKEHPEAAKHITLEVTEDVVLARAGSFIRQSIKKLSDIGIRISLDDFGTGFASFQHLRQLVLHEIKIDCSFVRTIPADPASKVIVEGFISIAAGLKISVVAEGVETEEQRRFLINNGCRLAQGFLFSEAVPANVASKMMVSNAEKLARLG